MPLCRTGVRHRLNDLILFRQRDRQPFGLGAYPEKMADEQVAIIRVARERYRPERRRSERNQGRFVLPEAPGSDVAHAFVAWSAAHPALSFRAGSRADRFVAGTFIRQCSRAKLAPQTGRRCRREARPRRTGTADGSLPAGRCGRDSGGKACPVIESSDGECGRHDFLISAGARLPGSIRRCGGTMTPPDRRRRGGPPRSAASRSAASLRHRCDPTKNCAGLRRDSFPGAEEWIQASRARWQKTLHVPSGHARERFAAIRPSTSRRGSGTSRFPKRSQPSLSTTRTRTAKRFGMPSGQPSGASADLGSRRGRAAIRRS